MLALAVLAFLKELCRMVSLILEGIPVEQRKAQAIIWFHLWWPVGKMVLKMIGTPQEVIEQIEKLAAGGGTP